MDFINFPKVLLTLATLILPILGDTIYCSNGVICHGNAPYCCVLDSGQEGCCWDTFVYEMWWFWLVWVVIFFLLLGCSLACWRRRQRSMRYVVMANSEYPTYGTVVHTGTVVAPAPQYGNHGTYNGATMPPSAPVPPPSYASKPPPYSG